MNWAENYRGRVTTAAEAVRAIRSGDHVWVHPGCSTPEELVRAMVARAGELEGVEVSHLLTFGCADYVDPRYARSFRHRALPPYRYTTPNAQQTGTSPYLWTRNLLANRLYQAPVVFLEPYVMNSEEVWSRVQAGEYEGERIVAGVRRKCLVREYADAVAAGVANYYRAAR